MPDTQETPPAAPVPPAPSSATTPAAPATFAHPAPAPIWMPTGGRGALYFWSGLCLLLALGLVCFYRQAAITDKVNRQLNDQAHLLLNERDKLRSQVDMLQTEVSQQGLQIKSSEETLREARQTLQAAQAQSDQQGQQSEAVRHAEADLQAAMQKALPAQEGLTFAGVSGDGAVIVRLAAALVFDGGDATPNGKGTDLLKKIAAVLKGAPNVTAVEVGSYSDPGISLGAGKPVPNVWDLSARRAAAAVRVLMDAGVSEGLLSAQGFGTTRPLFPNDGPDRTKNRRIEVTIRVGGEIPPPAGG